MVGPPNPADKTTDVQSSSPIQTSTVRATVKVGRFSVLQERPCLDRTPHFKRPIIVNERSAQGRQSEDYSRLSREAKHRQAKVLKQTTKSAYHNVLKTQKHALRNKWKVDTSSMRSAAQNFCQSQDSNVSPYLGLVFNLLRSEQLLKLADPGLQLFALCFVVLAPFFKRSQLCTAACSQRNELRLGGLQFLCNC